MKSHGYVLVPYDLDPATILDYLDELLSRFCCTDGQRGLPEAKFDYLVGHVGSFDDLASAKCFPAKAQRTLAGKHCEIEKLPVDMVPTWLVTPDGQWHDLRDHGWRMMPSASNENDIALQQWADRFWKLIHANPACWVIEYYAHS